MENNIKSQFLFYDFTYEGIRHRAKIRLEEGCNGVEMLYDDHDLEVTWEKRICHKDKYMIINVVVKDDWNDWETLGQIVASAWVCICDKTHINIIEGFEPDYWSYIDEETPTNNTDKNIFYRN